MFFSFFFVTENTKIRHDTLFRLTVGLLLKHLLWPNVRHVYIRKRSYIILRQVIAEWSFLPVFFGKQTIFCSTFRQEFKNPPPTVLVARSYLSNKVYFWKLQTLCCKRQHLAIWCRGLFGISTLVVA